MTTTWTIAIDWDRDGNYGEANEDVTSYVISANWFIGMRRPYRDIADDAMLDLTLNNSDKRFSPENSDSPLWDGSATPPRSKVQPYCPVRIQSNDGSTTRTHWVGWIETIKPAVNQYGKRVVEITAAGPMRFFEAAETTSALYENVRTDTVIAALLREVVIPPALSKAWIIGREGNSNVGLSTYFGDTSVYSVLDVGNKVLAIAADNWVRQGGLSDVQQDTFEVYRAIKDIVAAERGRFLFDREGKAIFWNRHRLLDEYASALTLNNTMTDLRYTYADNDVLKNEVIVTCHPRLISASSNDLLWQLTKEMSIPAGETRTLNVKYEDGSSSSNRIAGRNATIGGTAFRRGSATVLIQEAKANSATLKIVNDGNIEAVMTACEVRGQKIIDSGRMETMVSDANSITDFGRRTLKLNLPSVDNYDDARHIAQFELARRKQPRGLVSEVTLASHGTKGGGQHAHQLARTLGDVITITETQTAHSGKKYYIIGEAHRLSKGATSLETTWYLEPTPESPFPWKVGTAGRSEIGTTSYATY